MIDLGDFENEVKVLVIGNERVGKTALVTRFTKKTFDEKYKKTIGVSFSERRIDVPSEGEEATVMVWDTSGQETFDAMAQKHYQDASAVILVFATDDEKSYNDLMNWAKKIHDNCKSNCVVVLVQNKVDLIDDAKMENTAVEELARKFNVRLYRTCVKDNVNCGEIFEYIASRVMRSSGQSIKLPDGMNGASKNGDIKITVVQTEATGDKAVDSLMDALKEAREESNHAPTTQSGNGDSVIFGSYPSGAEAPAAATDAAASSTTDAAATDKPKKKRRFRPKKNCVIS